MRFIEFSNNYKLLTLDSFCERVVRKNNKLKSNLPLTISAEFGLVDQISFFNKTVASNNLGNYYLLEKGEFAYNKSYSNNYPWGAIKRLDSYDLGCLSTLYICFKLKDKSNINSDYLVHYFESPKWYREVANIAGEGARNHGLLNIAVNDFFKTVHRFPSLTEQIKIASLLTKIDERIKTQIKIIEAIQSQIKLINCLMIDKSTVSNKVNQICSFEGKTTRLSSDGLENGKYPFFTNEEEQTKFLNEYDYEGEYIIANTGGKANFRYYNGKFAAMSDCLVIRINDDHLTNFYYNVLKHKQEIINIMGFEGSGLKHLNKNWLLNLKIPVYHHDLNKHLFLINLLNQKLMIEKNSIELFKSQKNYLLNNLFI